MPRAPLTSVLPRIPSAPPDAGAPGSVPSHLSTTASHSSPGVTLSMVPVASIARETSRRAPSLASGAHGWERAGGGRGGLFKVPPRPAPALSPKRPSSWIPGSLPPLLQPRHVGLLLGSSGSVPGWRTDPVEPPSGVQGSCTPWAAGTPHGVRSVCGLASRAGAVSPSQSLLGAVNHVLYLGPGGGGAKWTYGVSETHCQKKFMQCIR